METMDILNLNELVENVKTEENKDALTDIFQEFKREHYPNVLSKTKTVTKQFPDDTELNKFLAMINAISHAEIGEFRESKEIIERLYHDSSKTESKKLIQLAELAFMSDYRLSRRIMTDAIKILEDEKAPDPFILNRCYLVLGEAEEHLQKYKRAIKYYRKGLDYFKETEQHDNNKYIVIYLHFKIGMMYSTLQETDQAIRYFKETNELADEEYSDIKAFSLVGLAKTYANIQKGDQAYPYLIEALDILEESSLKESVTYAEALTELAFYYFDQSKLKEAIPYYEKAIDVYLTQPQYSARMLGMIYMQYAFCLNHEKNANKVRAGKTYERAIELLEKANDQELLENALADVIAFFEQTNNSKKKRFFENKLVKNMAN